MARNKCKCPPGVPEWVVTFGDMMSLLLTFFILIVAFSEMKKDQEYQRVVTAVQEAFGYSGGVGVLPVDDPPLKSMIESLERISREQMKNNQLSQTSSQGVKGRRPQVTRVHEGMMFTIGGALMFEPASAVLLDDAKPELLRVARLLRGRNNKVSIRGHASPKVLPPESRFKDLWDLSYARAKAVKDFLLTEGSMREQVLVLEARADTEPLEPRAYTPAEQAVNRRVEIILTEAMVDDFHPDPNYTSEASARGE
ncbi:MAG: OmpA/MotB family protein [Planctomycetota bacterium]|jgi:chemotaxis protein MotB